MFPLITWIDLQCIYFFPELVPKVVDWLFWKWLFLLKNCLQSIYFIKSLLSQFFNLIFNLTQNFSRFFIQTYILVFLRFIFSFFYSFRGFTRAAHPRRTKLISEFFFISTAFNRLFHGSFRNTYTLIFN